MNKQKADAEMIPKIITKIKNLEGIDLLTLAVLVFATLYLGGHIFWYALRLWKLF